MLCEIFEHPCVFVEIINRIYSKFSMPIVSIASLLPSLMACLHKLKDARHYSKMKTPYLNFDQHSFDENKETMEGNMYSKLRYKCLKSMSLTFLNDVKIWRLCLPFHTQTYEVDYYVWSLSTTHSFNYAQACIHVPY